MRQEHPIDELFRHSLEHTERSAPASVWKGIEQQRNWGHRTLVLLGRRWGWSIFLALLLTGGVLSIGLLPEEGATEQSSSIVDLVHETPTQTRVTHVEETPPSVLSERPTKPIGVTPGPTAEGVDHKVIDAHHNDSTPITNSRNSPPGKQLETRLNEPVHAAENSATSQNATTYSAGPEATKSTSGISAEDRVVASVGTDHLIADRDQYVETADARPVAFNKNTLLLGTEEVVRSGPLDELALLPWERPLSTPSVLGPTKIIIPYVAVAEWFVSALVGHYDLERRWAGNDRELARSRAQADRPSTDLLYGFEFGRRWRDGTALSIGLEHGGGRSDLHYMRMERTMVQEFTTVLAVFDTLVLDLSVDSVMTITENVVDHHSTGRSSVWRVPLTVGWHYAPKRWSLGLSVQLAAEVHRSNTAYQLVRRGSDNTIETVSASQLTKSERTLGLITAAADLEVGYAISDTWSIHVGPAYTSGLWTLGQERAAYFLPTRVGGRLRLTYTLPHRSK